MAVKGIVFDFNGTLFWDTKYHNAAWDIFLARHNISLSDEEKHNKLHGKNNSDILATVFSRNLSLAEIKALSGEKEEIYRDICLENGMQLAPGAPGFLQFLRENRIPYTIATASVLENVGFFFDELKLNRYFDISKVIFDDGNLKSKPDPQMYRRAMSVLGIDADDAMIFEDSVAGIRAAENANAGEIIIVNSNDEDYGQWNYRVIRSFDEVDRRYFIR